MCVEQTVPRGNTLANRVPGNFKRGVVREALVFVVLAQREKVLESGGQKRLERPYQNPRVHGRVDATLLRCETKTAHFKKAFGRVRRAWRGDQPILEGSIVPRLASDGIDSARVAPSKDHE